MQLDGGVHPRPQHFAGIIALQYYLDAPAKVRDSLPWMAELVDAGIVGGWTGMKLACHLAAQRSTLNRVFAALIFVVAFYIIWRSARQA